MVSVLSLGAFPASALDDTGRAAVSIAEERKFTENQQECQERGWKCVPMAFDVYGAIGLASKWFVDKLAMRMAAHQQISSSVALRAIRAKMGLTLMRSNAMTLLSAYPIQAINNIPFGCHELAYIGSRKNISAVITDSIDSF